MRLSFCFSFLRRRLSIKTTSLIQLSFILHYRRLTCKDFIMGLIGRDILVKEKQIIDAVLLEYNRSDRSMTKLEFNIRPGVVVMDYVYDDLAEDKGEDPHKKRH